MWGFVVRGALVVLSLVLVSGPAAAHNFRVCEALLSSDLSTTKFYQQLKKLNPSAFESGAPDLEALYLLAKQEEWVYAPIPFDRPFRLKPIGQDLKNHLVQEFSGSYRLNSGNDEEMARFYINGLRGVYSRIGDTLRTQRVRSQFSSPLTHNEQVVFESLLSGFWFPKRLQDHDLSPENAIRVLQDREWMDYPWLAAREVLREWESLKVPFSRRSFMHWWSQKSPEAGLLSFSEAERLAAAIDLAEYSRHPICCVSKPGCHDCPLNRRTLINNF